MTHSQLSPFLAFAGMHPHVLGCAVYGSAARGDATARSDLDLIFQVARGTAEQVLQDLATQLADRFPAQVAAPGKSKQVLFAPGLSAKVEVFVVEELSDAQRYMVGSRVPQPVTAVWLDKTGELTRWAFALPKDTDDVERVTSEMLRQFQLDFEAGSSHHAGSDAFRAHHRLGQAFSRLGRLAWLATGGRGFLFSPRQLISRLDPTLRAHFEAFENVPDNAKLYRTKQQLLSILELLLERLERQEPALLAFLRQVLARDQFWNHRDSAEYVDPGLRRGVLFRGCSPQFHVAEAAYRPWLESRGIRTRIDLRGVQERAEGPVPDLGVQVVELPMEPGAPFDRTDPLLIGEDRYETGCRVHAFRRGDVIRAAAELVAEPGSVVFVHCKAGRDRTGSTVAFLQYLVGVRAEGLLHGFSLHANAADTRSLGRALVVLDREGGPAAMAERVGLDSRLLAALHDRLWETR